MWPVYYRTGESSYSTLSFAKPSAAWKRHPALLSGSETVPNLREHADKLMSSAVASSRRASM